MSLPTALIIQWLPAVRVLSAALVLFGAGVSILTTYQAWLDWGHVRRSPRSRERHRIRAWQSLRSELHLSLFQAVLLLLRVWGLWWQYPTDPTFTRQLTIASLIWTAVSVLFARNALMDLKDRRMVLNHYDD